MVRFVDLDEISQEDKTPHPGPKELTFQWDDGRPNPNYDLKLARLLGCYPIISLLAQYIDLTTLDSLSCSCRQFRHNLLQHRNLLIPRTLRCINEDANPAHRLGGALNASFRQWVAYSRNEVNVGRISSGKVGACARDLVGECRKCGEAFCRNCVIKAPWVRDLRNRHRRLCRMCMKSALKHLTVVTRSVQNESGEEETIHLAREPCICEQQNVWICQDCGQGLRSADTTYLRGWAWRTRYSACGGVGAGLGQGNEGVECGRYGDCLAAKEVEKEIECDADELALLEAEMEKTGVDGRKKWAGSSYMTHEIVGIGGKVKKKLKQEVLVGAIVKEYDDERMTGKFLQREQIGDNRSWCSWCARVVQGKKDLERVGESTESFDTMLTSSTPPTPLGNAESAKADMELK